MGPGVAHPFAPWQGARDRGRDRPNHRGATKSGRPGQLQVSRRQKLGALVAARLVVCRSRAVMDPRSPQPSLRSSSGESVPTAPPESEHSAPTGLILDQPPLLDLPNEEYAMSKITVPRPDVTVEAVSTVLRRKLGSRYTVTPSMMAAGFGKAVPGDTNTVLVAATWLERANVRITARTKCTEIDVSPGATFFGLIRLIHRVGVARKVRQALENAPELAGSD